MIYSETHAAQCKCFITPVRATDMGVQKYKRKYFDNNEVSIALIIHKWSNIYNTFKY